MGLCYDWPPMAHGWDGDGWMSGHYPLVNVYSLLLKPWPVEIVDLPSYKMVDLSSSLCKPLPEGNLTQITS